MSTKAATRANKSGQFSTDKSGESSKAGADRVTRLTDPKVHDRLADLKRSLSDPVKARDFLRDVGTLTASGKLSRRYGGR